MCAFEKQMQKLITSLVTVSLVLCLFADSGATLPLTQGCAMGRATNIDVSTVKDLTSAQALTTPASGARFLRPFSVVATLAVITIAVGFFAHIRLLPIPALPALRIEQIYSSFAPISGAFAFVLGNMFGIGSRPPPSQWLKKAVLPLTILATTIISLGIAGHVVDGIWMNGSVVTLEDEVMFLSGVIVFMFSWYWVQKPLHWIIGYFGQRKLQKIPPEIRLGKYFQSFDNFNDLTDEIMNLYLDYQVDQVVYTPDRNTPWSFGSVGDSPMGQAVPISTEASPIRKPAFSALEKALASVPPQGSRYDLYLVEVEGQRVAQIIPTTFEMVSTGIKYKPFDFPSKKSMVIGLLLSGVLAIEFHFTVILSAFIYFIWSAMRHGLRLLYENFLGVFIKPDYDSEVKIGTYYGTEATWEEIVRLYRKKAASYLVYSPLKPDPWQIQDWKSAWAPNRAVRMTGTVAEFRPLSNFLDIFLFFKLPPIVTQTPHGLLREFTNDHSNYDLSIVKVGPFKAFRVVPRLIDGQGQRKRRVTVAEEAPAVFPDALPSPSPESHGLAAFSKIMKFLHWRFEQMVMPGVKPVDKSSGKLVLEGSA